MGLYDLNGEGAPTFATIQSGDGLQLSSWKDKNLVNFVSTFPLHAFVSTTRKKHRKGESVDVIKPMVAIYYTKRMGHCDVFDNNAMRERPKQRNYVWRRARFASLLKYWILNLWSVVTQLGGVTLTQKEFLVLFSKQLVEGRVEKLAAIQAHKEWEKKEKKKRINAESYKRRKETPTTLPLQLLVWNHRTDHLTPPPVIPFNSCTSHFTCKTKKK